jgi:hypothetical protein
MEPIRKEQMHQYLREMVKDKDELLKVIDIIGKECENVGMIVSIEDNSRKEYTEKQKRKMTKAVFENKDILEQLEASEIDSENDDIDNVEQMMKLVSEAQNERKSL